MLTQERVRELFDLDYETGELKWKVALSNKVKIGQIAGGVGKNGYVCVGIENKKYYAHRLVWLHIHGYFPEGEIDHKNRCRWDNSPSNLREASRVCNLRNTPTPITNSSGVKGVGWCKAYGNWESRIQVKGRHRGLGYFTDFTEAVAHRLAAEQALDWSGCDSNSPAFQYMQNYLKGLNLR